MARQNNSTESAVSSADLGQNRLPFVSFALLILVFGPIITGILIDRHEKQLIAAVHATQNHLDEVRRLSQVPRQRRSAQSISPALRAWRASMDAALTSAEQAQAQAAQRVSDVHDIQDAVISVFGLLGLVAAFYSIRAVSQLRNLASANGRRVRALESLFDIAGHLSVSGTPEAMPEYLTARVGRVLQAKCVELWSYNATDQVLHPLRPAFGFSSESPSSLPVRAGEWPHELLFKNNTICRNAIPQDDSDGLNAQLREWNVNSALMVPLIADNQPVGLLCAYDKRQEGTSKDQEASAEFHDEDAQLLHTFATQAAFVLHSAQQYAHARERGEELATLARVTEVINSSLELNVIVPAFLQEAHSLVPYKRARLALLPLHSQDESWSQEYPQTDVEETELLRRLRGKTRANSPLALAPHAHAVVKARSHAADRSTDVNRQSFAHPDAADGAPMYIWVSLAEDVPEKPHVQAPFWDVLEEDDPLRTTLVTGQPQRKEILAIPLIVNQKPLGALVFEAGHAGDLTRFSEHHLKLAQQAAGQLAAAVQNALSYQEAMHRAEQLAWSLQETDHRIKNNLQAITAILDLYAMEAEADKRAKHSEEEHARQALVAREGLAHALREVRTIAAVHELISEDDRISRVKADALIENLIPTLLNGPVVGSKRLHISTHADDLWLPSKLASTLGLALNELIVNAVRHGGKERNEVTLCVTLKRQDDKLFLIVEDDGPGFPADFDARLHGKVGLGLTRMMIERDLSGELTYANNATHGGATVTAHVPYKDLSSPAVSFVH